MLKRGIQLDQRLWPEHPLVEALDDMLTDALVSDLNEALDVVGVLPNQLVSKSKDVHFKSSSCLFPCFERNRDFITTRGARD
jgi:hypothetical protein